MNDNINNKDAFGEFFREKLGNHQLPVAENGWSELEQRMKSRRRIFPIWSRIAGSVAAVVLLLVLFRPAYQGEHQPNIAKNDATEHDISTEFLAPKAIENQLTEEQNIEVAITDPKVTPKELLPKHSTNRVLAVVSEEKKLANSFTDTYETEVSILLTEEKSIAATTVSETEETVHFNLKNDMESIAQEEKIIPKQKKKNHNKWLLAAALVSGGSMNFDGFSAMNAPSMSDAIVDAETKMFRILASPEFTSITHKSPVSVGLSARKHINDRWSLESGLTYTYLQSRFENEDPLSTNAKLHLHYIGVPLHIVNRIVNREKWDFYISAGGMVEKGLRSIYIQEINNGNATFTTDARTGIDGLQWSLSGAMGTTYKINEFLGWYLEPKITYYLDNNQPMSSRTEKPFVLGMNTGIRFEF